MSKVFIIGEMLEDGRMAVNVDTSFVAPIGTSIRAGARGMAFQDSNGRLVVAQLEQTAEEIARFEATRAQA